MALHRNLALAALIALSALLTLPGARGAYDSGKAPMGDELRILRVTPAGVDVPNGRQVVVTFDRPVAPVGSAAPELQQPPVAIAPELKCHWHWIDPRALACELDAADTLAPATEYTVTVAAGLRAEDGAILSKDFHATFATARPRVREYSFRTWTSPGTPVVRLVFDQPVRRDSVEQALRFGGSAGVAAAPDTSDREVFWVLPLPGEKRQLALPGGTAPVHSDDRTASVTGDRGEKIEARRVWLLSPTSELPLDTRTALRVSPGLIGYRGPLPGKEQRAVVEFDTFPTFRFLGVRCRAPAHAQLIAPGATGAACNPFTPVSLVFSAPVIATEVKAHVRVTPDLAGDRKDYDPWANVYPYSQLGQPHEKGRDYEVAFPEHLKAFQAYTLAGIGDVSDEFGRKVGTVPTVALRTDHRPPRLRLTHPVAVLEQGVPSNMPLYVTNLTSVDFQYDALTAQGAQTGVSKSQPVRRVWDVAYAVPAMVRDLLSGNSGVVSGRLRPQPTPVTVNYGDYFDSDEDAPGDYVGEQDFFAEVTPFQVHVKLGHYNTLVWVTRLADGMPVSGAHVRVYEASRRALTAEPQPLAEGSTGADGIALLDGRERLDPAASLPGEASELIVRVDAGADLALLPLDYDFEIETYRASRGLVSSGPMPKNGHVRSWGTTAQGVYRLGDTVQFKFYVRNQNNRTLEPAGRKGYTLKINDPTGKTVHQVDALELSDFGAYAGEFKVPASGAVGWYSFQLTGPIGPEPQEPMRVLIADFTPAPFQVHNTLNGAVFQPGDPVETSTQATLHAGGPYSGADARVAARLSWTPIAPAAPELAEFEFQGVPVDANCRAAWPPAMTTIDETESKVDDQGELATAFTMPDADAVHGRLEIESAVRDERGKYVATRAAADYRGRDRYVGLHATQWTMEEGKPATVQYAVIDEHDRAVAGVPVSIAIHGQVTTAARVKGAGDAYLTSYNSEWVERGACAGASSAGAAAACTFTPGAPGLYRIEATVHDTHGREHRTQLCTWVTGKGRVLWEEPEDMSLTLVPQKAAYQVGERARYLVRNPFPGARALVTIERFGVIKSWVQTLAGSTPTIEFPVEADFLPGFYLSVTVISPRVAPVPGASTLDADGVDLGRPTYRTGYVKTLVSDPYKTLTVKVGSDRPEYKPGDTVKLDLRARPRATATPAEKIEFAVVVLDEAVFDLIQGGAGYFDPYAGFYRLDDLDVVNYGLLTRLVGLQKFEKKGANAGGDGGAGFDMRSVNKYVAYWNPAVAADDHGRASLQFTLPDNLTGWRVFAIATTPGDRLGLGDYKFKSSKLTELRPVMPNQLTQGDRVSAGFSVLNRSDRARTVTVTLDADGPIDGGKRSVEKQLTLDPFKRETVFLPIAATAPGTITLRATARDAIDRDGLTYALPVNPRTSLDVAASYGTTTQDAIQEPIVFPREMMPAVGALSVVASPSVIGNLDGAFGYLRDYRYACWEQQLTRALMAANYVKLRGYLSPQTNWPDAESDPQKVLDRAADFQAPNGGMTFWVPQDARVSPYLSAATALAFNRLREAGYRVPADVETHLQGYLDKFLRSDAPPTFFSEGMVSSVRAVALRAMAERGRLKLKDLERYRAHAERMDLFGLAAYLQAALQVKGGEDLAATVARRILGHANQSGGKFQFTEVWDDGYAWMLATPMRSQCAILQAFLAYGETPRGAELVGDVPFKLVGTITQSRGSRDYWQNTQENLYCTTALAAYAGVYEKQAPSFTLAAALDGAAIGSATFADVRDKPATLVRPNQADDPGRKALLTLERKGEGRVYYAVRLAWSPQDIAARETNAGFEVHREYSVRRQGAWTLLGEAAQIRRGELVRVDLYVSLPAARNFVVVDDPVPGGLEPVNRDLATASTVDADRARFEAAGGAFWFHYGDWSEYGITLWNFYHQELRHDSARFYADYLPAGHYHLSYAAQAIAEGQFAAAPTRAEEMYNPDVYGKSLPLQLGVAHE